MSKGFEEVFHVTTLDGFSISVRRKGDSLLVGIDGQLFSCQQELNLFEAKKLAQIIRDEAGKELPADE